VRRRLGISGEAKRRALVIGINEYDDFLTTSGSRDCGEKVFQILKRLGYKIDHKLIGRVRYNEMTDAVSNFAYDAIPADLLLFYFSGYCLFDYGGIGYFVVSDTKKNWRHFIDSYFPFKNLAEIMSNSPSKRIIIILDGINEHPFKRFGEIDDNQIYQELHRLTRAAVNNQLSGWQGSYFSSVIASMALAPLWDSKLGGFQSLLTYYLVKGLSGVNESISKAGDVTLSSLASYLKNPTEKLSKSERMDPIIYIREPDTVLAYRSDFLNLGAG
jgi:hypothetical protein